MGVVELFVHMPNPSGAELLVEDAGPPDQVDLARGPAVDVGEAHPPQALSVPVDHVHGIPAPPALPHLRSPFARVQVEREVRAKFLALWIRRVMRCHSDRVQDGGHALLPAVRLPPVPSEPLRPPPLLSKRPQRPAEIPDIAEL